MPKYTIMIGVPDSHGRYLEIEARNGDVALCDAWAAITPEEKAADWLPIQIMTGHRILWDYMNGLLDPKPRFTHDCDRCTYLGHHDIDDSAAADRGQFDLYFCPQLPGLPTVIARFGDEGSDYASGLHADMSVLKEAARRARAQGLLE